VSLSTRKFSWPLTLLALLVLYLGFWPVPVTPIEWTPAPAPALTGNFEPNYKLANTERISLGEGDKPEDVAIDSAQRIYAGMEDGKILRANMDGSNKEVFADTQGRPLGLVFDSSGNLIVADAIRGLLSIDSAGVIKTLTTQADGVPFKCTNDLDVARDGTIYFTDASKKFPLTQFREDLIESQPNGRLLAFEPKSNKTTVVLSNLVFANGVAISPDQSFLLVNETGRYRIHRIWLNGTKKGQAEIFADNLPGFPDGISSNGKDKFWLALVTPRDKTLDMLLPHPFLRKAVLRLPAFLQPAPKRYSFVLAFDTNGKVVDNLQDPNKDTCYAEIANVVEHNGSLYFGSIGEKTVGRYRLE
jgi:sugar lactone lactonase YvrE